MTELERHIRDEIAACGPLPFRRFMELALYHPTLGYYRRARDPFGVRGDYYTSSQLQPVFGRLIARKITEWRARLGNPPEFTVVELGAGRGETARGIRACLPDVRYIEMERDQGELPERLIGVIFSNEFFDALPVHVVRWGSRSFTGSEDAEARRRPDPIRAGPRAGEGTAPEPVLVERFVGVESERLVWMERGPSSPLLKSYVRRFAPSPAAGQILEVNLEALDWTERIARSLERGFVLTIDYGYTADEIAHGGRFPEGSLTGYYRHTLSEDVLLEAGERDITAHVNLSALVEHGGRLGLKPLSLETQAQFLLSIGEGDEFRSALEAETEREARRYRLLLKTLLYEMGETFRVLVQEKGA